MACKHCIHRCLCTHSSLSFSSDGSSFYKVMTGNFSSQLEIHAEVVARMNFRDFKEAIFTGPSCRSCHVKFRCTGVSASFRDGWKGFVTDNRIKEKDILVFRHARDKYFAVQVFVAIQREEEQNDTVCDQKKEIISGIRSQKSCEIQEIGSANSPTSTSAAVPNVGPYAKKGQRYEELRKFPKPVKTTAPVFSVTLGKSAISKCFALSIPVRFGERWLPNKSVEVTFLHHKNGGEWRHRLGIWSGGRRYGVYWQRFVIDNNLREGDKCVFKLMSGVNYIFMISVHR